MIEVIAEIGVNHNGKLATALELVRAAKEAGANTVKMQLWNTERVYPKSEWPKMKALEMHEQELGAIKSHAERAGMSFLCTPDDFRDVDVLWRLGVARIKTSSMDVTNLALLHYIGQQGLPVIYSTGACTWDELLRGYEALIAGGATDITVLHCVSAYPAPLQYMNMKVMHHLRDILSHVTCFGLSDHTIGHEAGIMAVAMGGTVFEKHITLDKYDEGPDHIASMTPVEFEWYAKKLRHCYEALGDGIKRVMPCEVPNREHYDRLVARKMEVAHADSATASTA